MQCPMPSPGTTSRSVAQRLKQSSLKDGPVSASIASTSVKLNNTPTTTRRKLPESYSTRQQNTLRIIAQFLKGMGLTETVESLVEESGCHVENNFAPKFREAVHRGHWNDALVWLDKSFAFLTRHEFETVRTIILEEKFFDLLAKNELTLALRLIREDWPDRPELKSKKAKMIRLIFTDPSELEKNPDIIKYRTNSSKFRRKLCKRIQNILPSNYMLPPSRLDRLIDQAYKQQVSKCPMHFRTVDVEQVDPNCIYRDHSCTKKSSKPFSNLQALREHAQEVMCVKFSHDGKWVASASKSNSVIIWKVDSKTRTLRYYKLMSAAHSLPVTVTVITWSNDGRFLAISASDYQSRPEAVVFNVQAGCVHRTIRHPKGSFSALAFFKSNNHLLAAADMGGQLQIFDMDRPIEGSVICTWEGFRIRSIYGKKDGKTILASDSHYRLRMYRIDIRQDETLFTENSPIINFSVHSNERYCVVTTKMYGLRLWDLNSRTLIRNLSGALQAGYEIMCSFGGLKDGYVATGTVDKKVMIWSINESRPVAKLQGHQGLVNAVSWCPTDPGMMVSCGDDFTVRVWSATDTFPQITDTIRNIVPIRPKPTKKVPPKKELIISHHEKLQ